MIYYITDTIVCVYRYTLFMLVMAYRKLFIYTRALNANFDSLCVPFILGTSPLSVFSTTDYEELEEVKELEEQFERMKFERIRLERMKGEQTTWF